jgi:hypothetical protein
MHPTGGQTSLPRRLGAWLSILLGTLVATTATGKPEPALPLHAGLLTAGHSAWLELEPGDLRALDLPPGVSLNAAEPLAAGWLVAGTQPAPGARELFLLASRGATLQELSAPPRAETDRSLARSEPVPLVARGVLRGLAWLEGASRQSLAVRAATWDGTQWSNPFTIAPPGPGSQLALTVAPLADGSWLLAWSAYDGRADTILWSRGHGELWSTPAPIAPAGGMPNITPDLVAASTGAMAVWSRLEAGDYRVVLARFTGAGWQPPVTIGPAGSVFPQFVGQLPGGGGRLLYRTAVPAGWTVVDLDAEGRFLRSARFVTADHPEVTEERGRPAVEEQPGGVRLRWPAAGHQAGAAWAEPR